MSHYDFRALSCVSWLIIRITQQRLPLPFRTDSNRIVIIRVALMLEQGCALSSFDFRVGLLISVLRCRTRVTFYTLDLKFDTTVVLRILHILNESVVNREWQAEQRRKGARSSRASSTSTAAVSQDSQRITHRIALTVM